MVTVESYYRMLANRQERELRSLYAKAAAIIDRFGVVQGSAGKKLEVATMFSGPERYRVYRVKGQEAPQIHITQGGTDILQPQVPTDLEESGDIRIPVEIATLSPAGGGLGTTLYGKDVDPHRGYIFDLPQLQIVLGFWNPMLAKKGT